jgi:hypothetical protein
MRYVELSRFAPGLDSAGTAPKSKSRAKGGAIETA